MACTLERCPRRTNAVQYARLKEEGEVVTDTFQCPPSLDDRDEIGYAIAGFEGDLAESAAFFDMPESGLLLYVLQENINWREFAVYQN